MTVYVFWLAEKPYMEYEKCAMPCYDAKSYPKGWGQNADNDIKFIKSSKDIATQIVCVCEKCGAFPGLKSWKAYSKGACKIAADVAAGCRTHSPT